MTNVSWRWKLISLEKRWKTADGKPRGPTIQPTKSFGLGWLKGGSNCRRKSKFKSADNGERFKQCDDSDIGRAGIELDRAAVLMLIPAKPESATPKRISLEQCNQSRASTFRPEITKRFGIAIYNRLWSTIDRIDAGRERGAPKERLQHKPPENAHPKDHVFSSRYIALWDAAKFSDVLQRGYRDEHILKAMAQKVSPYTMVGYEGVATLIDQARYCEEENIPGEFVEIGTHKGGCLGAMAHADLVFGRAL